MPICKCGTEVEYPSNRCPECGNRIKWIYPELQCGRCDYVWTPRKPNPKCCPNCGIRLNRIIHKDQIDEVKQPAEEAECAVCGKKTTKYTRFRPRGVKITAPFKIVCFICMIKHFKAVMEEDAWNAQTVVQR